MSQLWSL